MVTRALAILILPLIWSALLSGARTLLERGAPKAPDDRFEKAFLVLLLAPVALGVLLWLLGPYLVINAPLPVADMAEGWTPPVAVVHAAHHHPRATKTLGLLPQALLVGYALISFAMLARWLIGLARLQAMVARAQRRDDLGAGVRVSSAAPTPLSWGRSVILLPERLLGGLSAAQMAMVLRHEAEHLRRGDPLWFVFLSFAEAVGWFNPFLRQQTQRCRLAAELACDAAITAKAPALRRAYAETLILVLKTAAGDIRPYAPAAFSPLKSGDNSMRLSEIMRPAAGGRKPRRRALYAMTMLLALPCGAAQYAWSQSAGAGGALVDLPMSGRLSSPYGERLDPTTNAQAFHKGIDIAAPQGTEVHAAGGGKVVMAGPEGRYGLTVEIDHGGGAKTRYAHLSRIDVHWGDIVKADQTLGASGDDGAGPHLHFEVWKNGKSENPLRAYHAQFSGDASETTADGVVFSGHALMQVGGRELTADAMTVPKGS